MGQRVCSVIVSLVASQKDGEEMMRGNSVSTYCLICTVVLYSDSTVAPLLSLEFSSASSFFSY